MAEEGERRQEDRRELARDRTDWAMHRTLLAVERTFSAWLRTGLAALAAGLAIARLLQHLNLPLLTSSLGGLLVLVSAILFGIAFWRYRQGYREMKREGVAVISPWILWILLLALVTATALAFYLVISP